MYEQVFMRDVKAFNKWKNNAKYAAIADEIKEKFLKQK